ILTRSRIEVRGSLDPFGTFSCIKQDTSATLLFQNSSLQVSSSPLSARLRNIRYTRFRFVANNRQRFVDQDSYQPTAELTFVFEALGIPGCRQPAGCDSIVGSLVTAKNATRDEVKQTKTAQESRIKYGGLLLPPISGQEIVRHRSGLLISIS